MTQSKTMLATILFTLGLLVATHSSAEVTITGPRTLELEPGETRVVEYAITNTSEEPAQATVFFNDYAQMPDGSLVHVPARSLPASLFRIATFDRLTYVLGPHETARVPLRVRVPDAPLGGYWGVIGVESAPPPTEEGGNAVAFNIRYAMVTALEIAGAARHQVTLANISVTETSDGPALAVTLENAGATYERYQLALTFRQPAGRSFSKSFASVILPGLTVDLTVPVPADLPAGTHGVFAVLTLDGSRSEAVTTIEVTP